MKAVVCKAWGPAESLVVEDVQLPAPKAGEVLINNAVLFLPVPIS